MNTRSTIDMLPIEYELLLSKAEYNLTLIRSKMSRCLVNTTRLITAESLKAAKLIASSTSDIDEVIEEVNEE